ncbi:phage tail sheath family protein [Algibacter sp. Ld11]|uniref:phage tail sheath family protein n=1 Tax=Algibacter sp. Ld11 TaxID=649150 RepID=UPI00386E90CE
MAKNYLSPGVYIEELNALPIQVNQVATAIPAFIGYTEKAMNNGISLINTPTRISSFFEYNMLFGEGFKPKYSLKPASLNSDESIEHVITIAGVDMAISYMDGHQFYLHKSLKLFFENGGGACYIISVGTYGSKPDGETVEKEAIFTGLDTLLHTPEPTLIVIPDAVLLSSDSCYHVYTNVLRQCGTLRNRFAIFDVHNGFGERIEGTAEEGDVISILRNKTGNQNLNYGAVYYPWLHTKTVSNTMFNFENLDISINLETLLPEPAAKALLFNVDYLNFNDLEKQRLNVSLLNESPTYRNLLDKITEIENLLPPSGAIAGVFTTVDNARGVWKAPANVSLSGVIKPSININTKMINSLTVDRSGKSINTIRAFTGIGVLVWGARTLDGNASGSRYVPVSRTLIMLEQSIKLALNAFTFEPNSSKTWANVKLVIDNYLHINWRNGTFSGAKPKDAYNVLVGLNETMTQTDISNGKLIVECYVALIKPAEFMVIKLEHQMSTE